MFRESCRECLGIQNDYYDYHCYDCYHEDYETRHEYQFHNEDYAYILRFPYGQQFLNHKCEHLQRHHFRVRRILYS